MGFKVGDMRYNEPSLDGELWAPFPEYEDLYEVSNMGRVRTVLHKFEDLKRSKKVMRLFWGHIIKKPNSDKDGYQSIMVSRNGERSYRKVHRMVAIAFLDNPNNLPDVNHINGVKHDNRLSNIEWVSHRDNILHCYSHRLHSGIGEAHCWNKLKTEQVLRIREMWEQKEASRMEISKRFGVSEGCVSNIIYRKTWKHLPEAKNTNKYVQV